MLGVEEITVIDPQRPTCPQLRGQPARRSAAGSRCCVNGQGMSVKQSTVTLGGTWCRARTLCLPAVRGDALPADPAHALTPQTAAIPEQRPRRPFLGQLCGHGGEPPWLYSQRHPGGGEREEPGPPAGPRCCATRRGPVGLVVLQGRCPSGAFAAVSSDPTMPRWRRREGFTAQRCDGGACAAGTAVGVQGEEDRG
jgi:hypothetical protein